MSVLKGQSFWVRPFRETDPKILSQRFRVLVARADRAGVAISDFPINARQIGYPNLAALTPQFWSSGLAPFWKPTRAEQQRAHLAGEGGLAAPRVIAVTYDEARDRINLEFDRGFAVSISPRRYPGFESATASELREMEILGSGDSVHFSRIDLSLSVRNLLAELTAPLASSSARSTRARNQPTIRVQGGYLVGPTEETPPTPPTGRSSFRPAKT